MYIVEDIDIAYHIDIKYVSLYFLKPLNNAIAFQ